MMRKMRKVLPERQWTTAMVAEVQKETGTTAISMMIAAVPPLQQR
jgi:hypothetical protein